MSTISSILMVKRIPARRKKSLKEFDITCEQIISMIMSYLNGELGLEGTLAFEEHLSVCPDCVAFLNTYKKTVQSTQSLRYEDIPPEVEDRVRQFLKDKVKGFSRKH